MQPDVLIFKNIQYMWPLYKFHIKYSRNSLPEDKTTLGIGIFYAYTKVSSVLSNAKLKY